VDREFLSELFAPFGAIDIRRMFGGLSLSADGLTFALVIRDAIYLKADDVTIDRFEAEGCAPFQYEAQGRLRTIKSFWRMPDRLYDDAEEASDWARLALDAARRKAAQVVTKKSKAKSAKPKSVTAPKPRKRAAKG
jgi:DNA transformation protein